MELFSSIDFSFGNACRFEENTRRINNLSDELKLALFNCFVALCKRLRLLINSETIRFGPLIDWTIEPTTKSIK